jgi:hypothetical protein
LASGKQFVKTLMCLQRVSGGEVQGKRLLISARRSGDTVMLRIVEEG